jgi:hypothetical protein
MSIPPPVGGRRTSRRGRSHSTHHAGRFAPLASQVVQLPLRSRESDAGRKHDRVTGRAFLYTRSIASAIPCPTPMHIVHRP